jgi:hypothetical protein
MAVARDLPRPLSLEDALRLIHVYSEKGQLEKFDRAAMRWVRRDLNERSPDLSDVAKVVAELAPRRECLHVVARHLSMASTAALIQEHLVHSSARTKKNERKRERVAVGRSSPHPGRKRQKRPGHGRNPFTHRSGATLRRLNRAVNQCCSHCLRL